MPRGFLIFCFADALAISPNEPPECRSSSSSPTLGRDSTSSDSLGSDFEPPTSGVYHVFCDDDAGQRDPAQPAPAEPRRSEPQFEAIDVLTADELAHIADIEAKAAKLLSDAEPETTIAIEATETDAQEPANDGEFLRRLANVAPPPPRPPLPRLRAAARAPRLGFAGRVPSIIIESVADLLSEEEIVLRELRDEEQDRRCFDDTMACRQQPAIPVIIESAPTFNHDDDDDAATASSSPTESASSPTLSQPTTPLPAPPPLLEPAEQVYAPSISTAHDDRAWDSLSAAEKAQIASSRLFASIDDAELLETRR